MKLRLKLHKLNPKHENELGVKAKMNVKAQKKASAKATTEGKHEM